MLDRHILTFNENINGLRDFISLIGPFIEEHHKRALADHDRIIETFEIAKKIAAENDAAIKGDLESKIKTSLNGKLIKAIPIPKDENEVVEDKIDYIIQVPASINPLIESALRAPRQTDYQKDLLYKNAFIGLLSSVEWFYSQVLHYFYDKHPEAAGIKKKTMTLEELKTFSSVDDAEKYLIDSKIEEIFRGGFEGWIDILKNEIKLKLTYIKPFFSDLLEVYQRRNLLVHNGGIINSIYISKVSENHKSGIKIGDKLSISNEYLEEAIRKVHIVFTLIAAELWKKLEPDQEERADILNTIAYRNMLQKRWDVGEWISSFVKEDQNLMSRVKTVGLLNYWLCKKRSVGGQSIKKEVKDADFSDKSLRYQLAIAALLEDKKEFFELLPETLRTKSLDVDELLEFPIFEDMRVLPEFENFKETSDEFKELKNVKSKSINDVEKPQETLDEIIDEIINDSKI